jgi:AraC family transcriptional regulator of adaptative response/methylated-DNA-[protein]-cysteine methyltransferase
MEFAGLGTMVAVATDAGVCMFEYADYPHLDRELRQLTKVLGAPLEEADTPIFRALRRQVEEYLAGERREFDLPLDPVGTEFQRRVWRGLGEIPYGVTISYAAQAAALGCPSAVRAVAGANGRNKLSIVIPCHRVVGSDGSLTGYGGGVERKRLLLELERRVTAPERR